MSLSDPDVRKGNKTGIAPCLNNPEGKEGGPNDNSLPPEVQSKMELHPQVEKISKETVFPPCHKDKGRIAKRTEMSHYSLGNKTQLMLDKMKLKNPFRSPLA